VEALFPPAAPVGGKRRGIPLAQAFRAGFIQPGQERAASASTSGRGQPEGADRAERQFVECRTQPRQPFLGWKVLARQAVLNKFHGQGLRLIEVEKHGLVDLDIVKWLRTRPFLYSATTFVRLSGRRLLGAQAVLDGSIAATSENLLIYATSNRRHLMPEYMQENLETKYLGDEIHPGETVEEKISLSERFGLWVSFYPFDQDAYLDIANHWLRELGCPQDVIPQCRQQALQWALQRGSRSGRVAWQFARDYAGRRSGDGKTKP
jgi:predicted AAA+ superfamily ATPase